ncbi:hypothetical protein MICA_2422 [Micavibrio aeruginosavorus ARL-13]|uniref:Uncharacterized protein n=1 Tax=Micavibrio aeruginosavorus (strain ARL-13) TaxID=856793 RepID=G2KNS9_MICAA|nr:hypothetical protein MICA_2422 [Micavibrio aeruginosavorus ARL-13]
MAIFAGGHTHRSIIGNVPEKELGRGFDRALSLCAGRWAFGFFYFTLLYFCALGCGVNPV